MFLPEDGKRIMQENAQATKVQKIQKELDDEKNSIGNLAAGE